MNVKTNKRQNKKNYINFILLHSQNKTFTFNITQNYNFKIIKRFCKFDILHCNVWQTHLPIQKISQKNIKIEKYFKNNYLKLIEKCLRKIILLIEINKNKNINAKKFKNVMLILRKHDKFLSKIEKPKNLYTFSCKYRMM